MILLVELERANSIIYIKLFNPQCVCSRQFVGLCVTVRIFLLAFLLAEANSANNYILNVLYGKNDNNNCDKICGAKTRHRLCNALYAVNNHITNELGDTNSHMKHLIKRCLSLGLTVSWLNEPINGTRCSACNGKGTASKFLVYSENAQVTVHRRPTGSDTGQHMSVI